MMANGVNEKLFILRNSDDSLDALEFQVSSGDSVDV